MRSIRSRSVETLLDEFDVAQDRFLALDLDGLTVPELLGLRERYAFLMGRLDALKYELTSPFVSPRRRA
jgi:hypothetical protein